MRTMKNTYFDIIIDDDETLISFILYIQNNYGKMKKYIYSVQFAHLLSIGKMDSGEKKNGKNGFR